MTKISKIVRVLKDAKQCFTMTGSTYKARLITEDLAKEIIDVLRDYDAMCELKEDALEKGAEWQRRYLELKTVSNAKSMYDGLTFNTLRRGNKRRVNEFKRPDGTKAHNGNGVSEWTLLEWGGAASGELGELNNILKKVRRGDFTIEEVREEVAREIADVVIYLDLLAEAAGVVLGRAVMDSFNNKSAKQNIGIFLHSDDWHTYRHAPPLTVDKFVAACKICNQLHRIIIDGLCIDCKNKCT